MAETAEQEWQPARPIPFHGRGSDISDEEFEERRRRIIRVREVSKSEVNPFSLAGIYKDCDAKRFFAVHPNDADGRDDIVVCEHEILTG